MPEFSTLAAVDLGLGDFGSGITFLGDVKTDYTGIVVYGSIISHEGRLAFAERAQAPADRGKFGGGGNA